MEIEWVDGFEIKAAAGNGEIVISANREGLLSLAGHLTALADGVPGDHIHYDEHNSLEEGSTEMIIEKLADAGSVECSANKGTEDPLSSFVREAFCIEQGQKTIYCELYRPNEGKNCPILIISHGFNGSSADMRYEAECMAKRGVAVFCYDFCGGGLKSKSSGTTTQMTIPSEQEDLRIVADHVKKLPWIDRDRVFLFGCSQGGFVTALTAPELDGIAGVFLEFPAFCIPDDWKKIRETTDDEIIDCMGVPLGRCFADTVPDYDVFARAAEYTGPVIVFHGTADSLVSIDYSEKLCRQYKNAKLIRFPGQEHGFTEPFITEMAGVCTAAMRANSNCAD